jgi:hypothetical protein
VHGVQSSPRSRPWHGTHGPGVVGLGPRC